jgi:hypothetical protein
MSETFTISGKTLTVNVDIINKEMAKGLEWWKSCADGSKPICPFVSVRGLCTYLCGQIFVKMDVYKECPFKSGVYVDSFLKEFVDKVLEAYRKKENDKKMGNYSV